MTPDAIPHVVVVGGGVAGMVAARDLAVGGARVTLLEATGRLGGKVGSHEVGGVTLDSGAESFATRGGTVETLVRELGLGDELVTPAGGGAWLQPTDGPALPLPAAGLLGIPSVPLARDVIAVVGLPGALRAQLDALMGGLVASRERTLGAMVRRRMGRAVLDRLVAPVTTSIHSAHPDELEVDTVAPRLRAALLSEASLARGVLKLRERAPAGAAVQGLRGGVFRLAEALAADLAARASIERPDDEWAEAVRRIEGGGAGEVDVRLSAPVAAVDGAGATLADGARVDADHVVLAAPLGEQPGPAIALVTLVVDAPALDAAPRGTGVIVAPRSSEASDRPAPRAKALTHVTAKWAWVRESAGASHVLRLSYPEPAASAPDLADLARRDAALLLGVDLPPGRVLAAARADWTAPATSTRDADEGVTEVGERVAGAGLAAVVGHTRASCGNLLRRLAPPAGLR